MNIHLSKRGDRDSSWLVLRRGLAMTRRLLRGPAAKRELLLAVIDDVGPDAYSDAQSAAEAALKHDREALKRHLAIDIAYDRRAGQYWLANLGEAGWLDLPDNDLAAIALLHRTFAATGVEGGEACGHNSGLIFRPARFKTSRSDARLGSRSPKRYEEYEARRRHPECCGPAAHAPAAARRQSSRGRASLSWRDFALRVLRDASWLRGPNRAPKLNRNSGCFHRLTACAGQL